MQSVPTTPVVGKKDNGAPTLLNAYRQRADTQGTRIIDGLAEPKLGRHFRLDSITGTASSLTGFEAAGRVCAGSDGTVEREEERGSRIIADPEPSRLFATADRIIRPLLWLPSWPTARLVFSTSGFSETWIRMLLMTLRDRLNLAGAHELRLVMQELMTG